MSEKSSNPKEEYQEGMRVSQEVTELSKIQVQKIVQAAQKNFDDAVSLTEKTIQSSIQQMNTLLANAKVQISNPSGPPPEANKNLSGSDFPHPDHGDSLEAPDSSLDDTAASMDHLLQENAMNIQAAQQAAQDAVMHSIMGGNMEKQALNGEVMPSKEGGPGQGASAPQPEPPKQSPPQPPNMFNHQKPM